MMNTFNDDILSFCDVNSLLKRLKFCSIFLLMCNGCKGRGVQVERYKLAQQPMSFVQNEKVKTFLKASGAERLPLLLLDGETVMAGRYRIWN
ncbi:hypothetical protein PEC301899_10990 [Pectobacterium carotovorum subsp. carotovorum]|nr:hypothetical protein PEC301899_10990 [Pectobacterium carotovorum subsp. carotovorum]